jgi:hypothetical protein
MIGTATDCLMQQTIKNLRDFQINRLHLREACSRGRTWNGRLQTLLPLYPRVHTPPRCISYIIFITTSAVLVSGLQAHLQEHRKRICRFCWDCSNLVVLVYPKDKWVLGSVCWLIICPEWVTRSRSLGWILLYGM